MLDLRSDTVTQPTPAMRAAIAAAEVGDDVIDVDPSVSRLERLTAELLGMEAAIFMPSGTMTNQTAVWLHCRPGDELLCEAGCHIYNYEQGGYAQLSGVAAHTVTGESGILRLEQLRDLIRPDNEHLVRTRLVCLENTHNRGGGRVHPYAGVREISEWARGRGLAMHLDGARLWNAVAATGVPLDRWAACFDTVSVCFSKGLGAPVGSALAGPREAIARARRRRKVLGGGMRQAGIIAAGALYALEHHRARLTEDHAHAQLLAAAVREAPGLRLAPEQVDTNIVIFQTAPAWGPAAVFAAALKERGVLVLAVGKQLIRAVTHLHITAEGAREAGRAIAETADRLERGWRPAAAPEAAY